MSNSLLKLLAGLLLSVSALAQNAGIGTAAPQTTLHVQGDFKVNTRYISTKSEPTPAQTFILTRNSANLESDSIARVFDPGGPSGNYGPSLSLNFSMGYNFDAGSHVELLIEQIDLGAGDSLLVYGFGNFSGQVYAVGNGFKASNIQVLVPGGGCRLHFKSNADSETGAGFSILLTKKYIDNTAPDVPVFSGYHGLTFHSKKSALRVGDGLAGQIGNNSVASGARTVASGENSFASGFRSTASGVGSFAAGRLSFARGDYSSAFGDRTVAKAFASTVIGSSNDTLTTENPNGWVSTDPHFIIGNGNDVFRRNALVVYKNGNTDINGSTKISGNNEINGFTRLGEEAQNAPRIKMKKINGTGPAVNGSISIAHGLNAAKILQVSVLMEYGLGAGETIPANYTTSAGYQYEWQVRPSEILIINRNGNSANIGSRPVRILITYEE